jgi:hypothetical protein
MVSWERVAKENLYTLEERKQLKAGEKCMLLSFIIYL